MTDPEALAGIKDTLSKARLLELSIDQTEQQLKAEKAELHNLKHTVLPEKFNTAGLRTLTLEADGNFPSLSCSLRPYYHAVIPVKWDDVKRAEALAELEAHNAGDLAKRVITIRYSRSDWEECAETCAKLDDLGVDYSVGFELPWKTLTSWLQETVERGVMPDLEKIGGQVGQVVNLKVVEEE